MNNKVWVHDKAVNLARRYSVQNENDLLQEDFMSQPEPPKKLDHDACQQLSMHLIHLKALPRECQQFQDVVTNLKRRDSDTSHPTQWMS